MGIAVLTPPLSTGWRPPLRSTAAALTALVLVGSLAATSGGAQAHSHWGIDVGIGIAAGALLKAAAVSMPTLSQFRLAVWSRVMTVGNARKIQVCAYYY